MEHTVMDSSADQAVVEELIIPGPAIALAGLLDLPMQGIVNGWKLPLLWHWVYLLERDPQSDLGPEGHAAHGIPRPPRPGLRRMFAGGRVHCHRPLYVGAAATKTTEVLGSKVRNGRSGSMTIVTTHATIVQAGELAIAEEQDIIYREPTPLQPSSLGESNEAGPARLDSESRVTVDPTLLFRFSALTYNAHRIHYDLSFCAEEDYPNLVVHGPLQALLMAEAVTRSFSPDTTASCIFSYRLVAPLILGDGLTVVDRRDGSAMVAAVHDDNGRLSATSTLTSMPCSSLSRRYDLTRSARRFGGRRLGSANTPMRCSKSSDTDQTR
jgi:3-methylfumaryl-CoA hydratase